MGAEDAPAYTRREAPSSEHQADFPPAYEPGARAQPPPPPPDDSKGGSTGGSFGLATPGTPSFYSSGPGGEVRATLDGSGRVNVDINLRRRLPDLPSDHAWAVNEYGVERSARPDCPPLQIVMFLLGGKGHRVRIATHTKHRNLVVGGNKQLAGRRGKDGTRLEGRLEFFDVGGDPARLLPGLVGTTAPPREALQEILAALHRSAFYPDPTSGNHFAADAIIANPWAMAHVPIAASLGVPLVMSSVIPWSPTTAFPHPLAKLRSNAEHRLTSFLSYPLVDSALWSAHGRDVSTFAKNTLGVAAVKNDFGSAAIDMLKIPWVYGWSEGVLGRPEDWVDHIDVPGFFLPEDTPNADIGADELLFFLKEGKSPIYVDLDPSAFPNPRRFVEALCSVLEAAEIRAILRQGWEQYLGGDVKRSHTDLFVLHAEIPLSALLTRQRVAAVVHHGGQALQHGLPSLVIPFESEQRFWATTSVNAGGGPPPIPLEAVNAQNLSAALNQLISPHTIARAKQLGTRIGGEDGAQRGVDAFHRHLPLSTMRCDFDPSRVALWYYPDFNLKLSGAVAGVLAEEKKFDLRRLELLRTRDYDTVLDTSSPFAGGARMVLEAIIGGASDLAQVLSHGLRGTIYAFWPRYNEADGSISPNATSTSTSRSSSGQATPTARATSFKSGAAQAGRTIAHGLRDGARGLVTEPYKGAKHGGLGGFVGGSIRGLVGIATTPIATAVRATTQLVQGTSAEAYAAYRSTKPGVGEVLRAPREAASRDEARLVSPEERKAWLKQFGKYDSVQLGKDAWLGGKAKGKGKA
ncbi:hypothetical protein EHS25_009823 [Saitozyma podzolica]|uniref:Glycosyltransferase family 28 N-terminal domain-containing protein n=1 Tax=Saitozyma podzolica TaxID=1890683 RepID=A0A427YK97_9TREE|nr:hypothetical protein EHS25_009823 [Saitozyma podzolica]